MNWAANDWYYVPTTSYADLTGLAGMARTAVTATAGPSVVQGGNTVTTVTLKNIGGGTAPAFFTDAHIVDAAGKPILPVQWSDNEVTLWPGESVTLTATYRATGPGSVRVSGWNIPTVTVTG
jgi:exo-1,4-beta-D-glucosaminidase